MIQPTGDLERSPSALAGPVPYAISAAAIESPAQFGLAEEGSPPPENSLAITPGKVLRALRRHWIVAMAVGVLGAAGAGYIADQFVGPVYTVRTQIYLPLDRPGLPFGGQDGRIDAATLQRRQSAHIRSRTVLQAALQQPGISDLAVVRSKEDPVGWLERDLLIDFGSSPDIMRVSLKGAPPEELIVLLNAVAKGFLQEGVNRELTEKTAQLNWLRQLLIEEQGRLDLARAAVGQKAGQLNAPDLATVRLQYHNDLSQLNILRIRRSDLMTREKGLRQTREELLAHPLDTTSSPGIHPAHLKAASDLAQAQDSVLAASRVTISRLNAEIAEYRRVMVKGSTSIELDAKEKELKDAGLAMAAREAVIRAEVAQSLAKESGNTIDSRQKDHQARLRDLKAQADGMKAQVGSLDAEIEQLNGQALAEAKGIVELDRLSVRVTEVEDRIRAAKVKVELIETDLGIASPYQARVQDDATVTQVPNPMKKTWMVIGAIAVGFMAGLFGIAFLDLRKRRIDSPEGVDRQLHTGLVGCIPRASSAALAALAKSNQQSTGAEEGALRDAADSCRALLLNALTGRSSKVVMVTSAAEGEGKTSLAAQLAMSLARAGYRTLLIDADVRRPGIHTLFGRSQSPGLTDVLRKTYPLQNVVRRSPLPNLGLIPAGNCNPQEAVSLLQLRLRSLLAKCKTHFEVIVIDTPPMNLPDAMIVGRHVDGTILSLMNEVSTLPASHAVCGRLRAMNIPLLGAVLNGARLPSSMGYY
jgi:capsular exopolysaccharide synthesis family protein